MKKSIAKSVMGLSFIGVTAILFGAFKTLLAAFFFGADKHVDAFYLAMTVPVFLGVLFSSVLQGSFMPLFIEAKTQRGDEDAWRLFWSTSGFLSLGILVVVLLGMYCAPEIMTLIGRGFDLSGRREAAFFLRILMPLALLATWSTLITFLYNSYKQFSFPAGMNLLGPVSVIVVLLLLSKHGVIAFAVAVLLAESIVLLAKSPILWEKGLKSMVSSLFKVHPEMKHLGYLALHLLYGAPVYRVNTLVDRALASTLPEGSISSLNYGYQLIAVTVGLLAGPLTTTIFPYLSEAFSRDFMAELRGLFLKSIRSLALFMLPFTVLFFILALPIVRMVFERGQFDFQDALLTASTFRYYSLGLLLYAVGMVIQRCFYALQDTKTMSLISLFMVCMNVVLDLVLMRFLGVGGIALSTSLVYLIWVGLLGMYLSRKIGTIFTPDMLQYSTKLGFSALLMAGVVFFAHKGLEGFAPAFSFWGFFLHLSLVSSLGIGVYLFSLYLMGVEEMNLIKGRLSQLIAASLAR